MITQADILKIYNKLKNTKGGNNGEYGPELENIDPKIYDEPVTRECKNITWKEYSQLNK